jgi:predicted oxidoreductase (fatty acid repression mutant protein)
MDKTILDSLAKRRTIYEIDKNISISKERIQEIVETATMLTPSAFNSQSARVVILFGGESDYLWKDVCTEILRKIVPQAAFAATEEKMRSFGAGAGTILYFEEMKTIESLQEQFPLYKDNFPVWSLQGNAMLELAIWTALEEEGLGASLQHYNPLIDDQVKTYWSLPESWKLVAQMPFGNPTAEPKAKETMPISERVFVKQ